MKKIKLIFALMMLTAFSTTGQNESDALRYSYLDHGGTARFMSMGGAFGSLGGDFSTLSTNPAGIGIFRGSEFSITPSLNYSKVNSMYYGVSDEDIKYSFNLKNIGFVFTVPLQGGIEQPGMKSLNFGFGLNQHNTFNNRVVAEGFNNQNSIMTHFLNQANEEGSIDRLNPFSTQLAYDTWLLGTEGEDETFFVDMPEGNVHQRMEKNTSGSIRELVLTMGGNYNDVAYFGATIGIPSVRYEENFTFIERDTENLNDDFNSLEYNQYLYTTGRGFNVKLGAIFRIADIVRLGAAVHTPTFFKMEDEYKNSMQSDLNFDDYPNEAESPTGVFEYEINTPLKAIGSAGVVIGKFGIISVDYEFADYSSMRLRSDDYHFSDENRAIKSDFTQQHKVRFGGEVNLSPVLVRGGYSMYTSPYSGGLDDLAQTSISAGIGLRDKGYFLDFAYIYSFYNEDFYPYTNVAAIEPATFDYTHSNFVLTLGLRW